jgi:hypothetical protein
MPADQQEGSGTSTKPPWEKRGIEIPQIKPSTQWKTVWGDEFDGIDPVQDAANYYLLEPLSHGLLNNEGVSRTSKVRDFLGGIDTGFDMRTGIVYHQHHGHNKWVRPINEQNLDEFKAVQREAQTALRTLVENRAPVYANYTRMAIGGELRYHRCVGSEQHLPGGRHQAWNKWKTVIEHVGPEVFADAKLLFSERKWRGGFGGKKWADIANVMYLYETGGLSQHLFLDRVFNLQHNGGSLLTKVGWGFDGNNNLQVLQERVLPAHAANPAKWGVLYKYASPHVRQICDKYWDVTNVLRVDAGLEKTKTFQEQLTYICGYCCVLWGAGHTSGCGKDVAFKTECDGLLNVVPTFKAVYDPDWNLIHSNIMIGVVTTNGTTYYKLSDAATAVAPIEYHGASHITLVCAATHRRIKFIAKPTLDIKLGQLYVDVVPELQNFLTENGQLCLFQS